MSSPPPQHPGVSIKQLIENLGVTVKDAAEMMGVGRPALSNLLNERSALSPEMAVRLEKAFGAKMYGPAVRDKMKFQDRRT